MQTLTVSIIQSELQWHDNQGNRQHFDSIIATITEPVDLIVLPEMFTSGFTMDAASNAEEMDGASILWMKQTAAAMKASLCGSLIIKEHGNFYNRFVIASKDGEIRHYDKRHLFRLANEQNFYARGENRIAVKLNGFRICPMICYDLRFPVWSRYRGDYDLLLYVANWPSRRQFAWDTLLRARAIENLSYVVGVNRVGVDGNDLPYSGGSSVINYLGADIANLGDNPGVATVVLDKQSLINFREQFAFHKDADDFSLI